MSVPLLALCCTLGVGFGCAGEPMDLSRSAPAELSSTVLVELFTSEGCSSCPPADVLLRELVEQQPIDDVEIVALAEHVDYWNYLGWTDEFSSAAFSERQTEYQRTVFQSRPIYTPQLVVDGRVERIGNDVQAVKAAIRQAGLVEKATIGVEGRRTTADAAAVHVSVDLPASLRRSGDADVVVAVTEDHLVTEVQRGENRGRRLAHTAVTRSLSIVGHLAPGMHVLQTETSVGIDEGWKASDLRIVAFVQERDTRAILGIAAARLGPTE